MLALFAAWLFIIIWSTGFVVARGIAGHIDPYLFLLVRFICVLLIFTAAATCIRAAKPSQSQIWKLMGTGAFMQGLYLGPGFWAVANGLEAGIMSLLGSLQPPVTAILAWYIFREKFRAVIVVGLSIGLLGVAIAVAPELFSTTTSPPSTANNLLPISNQHSSVAYHWVLLAGLLSISSITVGTLLQKSSIGSVPLLSSMLYQTLGAVIVMAFMAAMFAEPVFPINTQSMAYLSYAVFILSIGGFTLLTWLVRVGNATHATSLLFMVPPVAAILAYLLYGESLSRWQLSGFIIALVGVMLARRPSTKG